LLICQLRPIGASARQFLKQGLATNLQLPLAHCPSHQLSNDCTLVLVTKGLIERQLDFIGNAEVDSSHRIRPLLLKSSTTVQRSATLVKCAVAPAVMPVAEAEAEGHHPRRPQIIN
jgi:hypothetical protein